MQKSSASIKTSTPVKKTPVDSWAKEMRRLLIELEYVSDTLGDAHAAHLDASRQLRRASQARQDTQNRHQALVLQLRKHNLRRPHHATLSSSLQEKMESFLNLDTGVEVLE